MKKKEMSVVYFAGYFTVSVLIVILLFSCNSRQGLFTSLPAQSTPIAFSNVISENNSINFLASEYDYNGGDIAIADGNNDNLQLGDKVIQYNFINGSIHMEVISIGR